MRVIPNHKLRDARFWLEIGDLNSLSNLLFSYKAEKTQELRGIESRLFSLVAQTGKAFVTVGFPHVSGKINRHPLWRSGLLCFPAYVEGFFCGVLSIFLRR